MTKKALDRSVAGDIIILILNVRYSVQIHPGKPCRGRVFHAGEWGGEEFSWTGLPGKSSKLSVHTGKPCVSLFMPAFRAGRDTEQNPIRFKNLVKEAENRLSASGIRPAEIQDLLKTARSLVDDPLFWQRQGDGLAVFLTEGLTKMYRLPVAFHESAVTGRRFNLTPLLPYFAGEGRFTYSPSAGAKFGCWKGPAIPSTRLTWNRFFRP